MMVVIDRKFSAVLCYCDKSSVMWKYVGKMKINPPEHDAVVDLAAKQSFHSGLQVLLFNLRPFTYP